MRVQVVANGSARSVALSIDGPDATVADLAQALFLDPATALVVDGVVHLPDSSVDDVALVDGAFITSLSDRETNRSGIGNTWVGIVAGPHAGMCRRLDAHGTVAIGRDPSNDLAISNTSVSNRHASIELDESGARISDLDSLNGTWVAGKAIRKVTALAVDEPVQLGSSTATVRAVSHHDRARRSRSCHCSFRSCSPRSWFWCLGRGGTQYSVCCRRLWQSATGCLAGDVFAVSVRGTFARTATWGPPTEFSGSSIPDDVAEAVDAVTGLVDVEILVDLREGPVGLVGPNAQGAAAARSLLLQLSAHHGPADAQIAIFTTPERLDEWRWAAWLPHASTASEAIQIVVGDAATSLASSILQTVEAAGSAPLAPGWILVVDDVDLLHQRSSATRRLLEMTSQRIFGVVLTSSVDQLPASIASVVEVQTLDGAFSLSFPANPELRESGMLDAPTVGVAEELARSLARFDDPEKRVHGGALPRAVSAAELFGELDPVEIQERWMLSKQHPSLVAPLGIAEHGIFEIDLVSDGPHGLIAGTTGAGKSELLRTLIMGLASNYGPDDLVFVLIDYKGGSAFDCCAALPHVVGMVTDLDDHLAERALRSLEAELHVREQVLRNAIRANTNLRIALRVQDAGDSTDVIDAKVAAEIPRTVPGRAYVRRGEGDLVAVQTAYLSGPAGESGPPIRTAEVPVGSGAGPQFATAATSTETTDLELLVDVLAEAATNHRPARRPWLDVLPSALTDLDIASLANYPNPLGADVILAIGDDPAAQRRVQLGWRTADGHLAVVGVLGSGVTTSIRGAIAALADDEGRAVWVFPVDHGAGGLAGIDRFAHVADVIEANDDARQSRLLQFIGQELESRRNAGSGAADDPLIVVAVDGIAAFAETNDLVSGTPNGELWARIGRDGPAVGIVCLLGAERYADLPRSIRGAITQHVVLEQAGTNGYGDFGIRMKSLPAFVPGRALWGSEPLVAQVIDWDSALDVDHRPPDPPLPTIEALPTNVSSEILLDVETLLEPGLSIPIGLDGTTRMITRLTIRAGEHATVSGPSQSGRTSALRTIARQLRAADPTLILVGLSPTTGASLFDDGVFDAGGTVSDLEHVLSVAANDERRWVVIVDDADRIDAESGPLVDLAKNATGLVTLIVGVRSSSVRQAYGHWTRFVRASGTGLLLMPDNSVDGDILGVRLPRSQRVRPVPGRGYLVSNGEAHLVQVAL